MWFQFTLLILILGCRTVPETKVENYHVMISPNTYLKDANKKRKPSIEALGDNVQIPSSLLEQGQTTRASTELREGPGLQYNVLDNLITNKEDLIILEHYGQWKRIYISRLNISGWLHKKTIKTLEGVPAIYSLPINKLSTAIATHHVKQAYSYPDKSIMPVSYKKGSQFFIVKQNKRRVLAWIQETNSVVWFSTKDLK